MLWLLATLTVLLALSQAIALMSSALVAVVVSLLWVPMVWVLYWRNRLRRLAFRRVYVEPQSPWFHYLKGGPVMFLLSAIWAVPLAAALGVSLARGQPTLVWLMLLLSVPAWALGLGWLRQRFRTHIQTDFALLLCHRLLYWGLGLTLLLALTLLSYWRAVPDLGDVTLDQAMTFFASQQQAESDVLRQALYAIAGLEGAHQWLVQQSTADAPGLVFTGLAWATVLVREWLLVWPWLVLCQAVTLFTLSRGDTDNAHSDYRHHEHA